MNTVDLTPFSKEILTSKTESAMLVGVSWAELLPEDRMVRLLVVRPGQTIGAPVDHFLIFMHEITRLPVKKDDRVIAHQGPDQIDIHQMVVMIDGVDYGISARMSASWDFFSQTHEF